MGLVVIEKLIIGTVAVARARGGSMGGSSSAGQCIKMGLVTAQYSKLTISKVKKKIVWAPHPPYRRNYCYIDSDTINL